MNLLKPFAIFKGMNKEVQCKKYIRKWKETANVLIIPNVDEMFFFLSIFLDFVYTTFCLLIFPNFVSSTSFNGNSVATKIRGEREDKKARDAAGQTFN